MKLSIVIPVYNEEKTVEKIIKKVNDVSISPVKKEILVVNDASVDSTKQKLDNLKKNIKSLVVIEHKKNLGKGAAIKTGLKKVSGDYVIIQDADLEYNPDDYKRLLDPILSKKAKVVYGTRLHRLPNFQKEERTFRFVLHYFGNRLLSLITSVLYGQWITDMETCYKLFPASALKKFTVESNGFSFEPEITAKLIKSGYRIIEIPIVANPRGYDEGKKLHTFSEGFIALWTLVKLRVKN